jgi:hypothetical protein
MGSFLSDTFFKSFSSKYVYVEAATTMAVPSHVLSPLYTVHVSAEIETGMAGKSSWDLANRRQKLVWFGELERKLAKLSKTTFTYCSSS